MFWKPKRVQKPSFSENKAEQKITDDQERTVLAQADLRNS